MKLETKTTLTVVTKQHGQEVKREVMTDGKQRNDGHRTGEIRTGTR